MADWIANGESGSDVRGKLNSLMIPISSGTLMSPVEYFDVALPAGYLAFQLSLLAIKHDQTFGLYVGMALSQDAGATFLCDPTNNDTYSAAGGAASTFMFWFGGDGSAILSHYAFLAPGSVFEAPSILHQSVITVDGSTPLVTGSPGWAGGGSGQGGPNSYSVIPWPLGRCNKARFIPSDGNSRACDPPTTGWRFVVGSSWALFGIVAP